VESTSLEAGNNAKHPSEGEIQAWLISYLSELLEMDPNEFETNDALASYGLDSSGAVCLIGDVGEWLDLKLSAEILYNYPTIESLTRYLAAQRGE
jgi:acyl carrier protein